VVSEQQQDQGAVAAQPAAEPEAPVVPPANGEHAQARAEQAPAEQAEQAQPDAQQAPEAAAEQAEPEQPAAEDDQPAAGAEEPAVGPKIVGVAEEKPLPVVKKRLQEKPKREPLPWPELRAAVAATKDGLDVAELKELFRLFPEKLRDEVTDNVRAFRKGARRPISQHAAKQLARAAHTARRMKKNAQPSGEVAEALGQAMAAELIAQLEPEKAAQVILPKRDLLEREARQAQRRARDEEDKRRDEQRRRRREDAKSSRQQTSFGQFSGTKIKGLDELAAMFRDQDPPAEAEAPADTDAGAAAEATTPAPAEPQATTPAAEPEAPVTPPADAAPADEAPAAEPTPDAEQP
jgi:hypothetical protein